MSTGKVEAAGRSDAALPEVGMLDQIVNVFRQVKEPAERQELAIAQYQSLKKQIPLLYVILLANAWMVAFSYFGAAPRFLTVYVPGVFTVLCGIRFVKWMRQSGKVPTYAQARRMLAGTTLLAGLLSAIFVLWGLTLYGYGTAHMQGQIAFFIGITVIGCIFCLMHLPRAALLVTAVVNIPFVLFFADSGSRAFSAIAVNVFLVSMVMMVILAINYAAFASLIRSRRSILDKQAAMEALDAHNLWLANHDTLTQLPNRHSFLLEIEARTRDLERSTSHLFIGVLDLDGFRVVNDAFGHRGGDQILVEVAQRLSKAAGDTFRVFRLAGDEFGIVGVCPWGESATMLDRSEAICAALEVPYGLNGVTARITATIGLASSATVAGGAQQIHEAAEYALINAKQNQRRGHTNLFSFDHQNTIRRHSLVEQELQTADLEAELTMVFQPIVAVATGTPIGFEALARWDNRQLGRVSPAEFIQIAERAGLANRLTCVLLSKALAVAATWPPHLRLSFNLSMQDICSSENVLRLVTILNKSAFDPKRIDFEITETAVVGDFDQLVAAVTTLKSFGAGISLDDFGTGYSTLWQVNRLPLDKIKIDRSFVTNIDTVSTGYKIVKSVVALCRDMKISCIIEGVETQGELDTLRNLDCNLVQGYFYSKPLLASEINGYVESAGASALFDSPDTIATFPFETPARRTSGARKPARRAAT